MQRIKSISMWKSCRQTLNNPFLPNLHIIRPLVWEFRAWNQWVLCNLNWLQHRMSQKRSQLLHFILWLILGLIFGLSISGSFLASCFGAGVVVWCVLTVQCGHVCATTQSQPMASWTSSRTDPGCGYTHAALSVFLLKWAGTQLMLSLMHFARLHVTCICRRRLNRS